MENDTMKVLLERKSVRVFEDKKISESIKEKITQAVLRAPTAGNSMVYSILDITDQAKKDYLVKTCDNQPFIATAPMVWIFLADYRRWVRKFQQAGCEGVKPPDTGDLMIAMNDAIIAAHTACIAAESFGIGSCYIGDIIENWEEHQKLLKIPPYVIPVSMLVFGYPTQQQKDRAQPTRQPEKFIVFENEYRDLTDAELQEFQTDAYAAAFYKRKYISDFSVEMERSSEEMFKNWGTKEICDKKE